MRTSTQHGLYRPVEHVSASRSSTQYRAPLCSEATRKALANREDFLVMFWSRDLARRFCADRDSALASFATGASWLPVRVVAREVRERDWAIIDVLLRDVVVVVSEAPRERNHRPRSPSTPPQRRC